MNEELIELPASFRVIGVGHGIEEVIDTVKSFGFNRVSAEVVKYPFDCTPNDDDRLAIIVFTDCDDNANSIARRFHEAGVLTIGFSGDADASCYDSVMQDICATDSPEVIRELLQPIVIPGIISYTFHDLYTTLRGSGSFIVRTTAGNNVTEAVEKLRTVIEGMDLECVEHISVHLYFNPNRSIPVEMKDIVNLSELMSNLPEPVNAIWSVNHDVKLNNEDTKLSVILAGKEVGRCLEK